MRAAWKDLPWKCKVAVIFTAPLAIVIAFVLMIPVILLASLVGIVGAAYTLVRLVILGKRPPPKTFPDPGREAGG